MLPKLNSRAPYRAVTTLWYDQSEFYGFQYDRWNGAEMDSEDMTRPVLIMYIIKAAGWNVKIVGLLEHKDYVNRAFGDKDEFRRSTQMWPLVRGICLFTRTRDTFGNVVTSVTWPLGTEIHPSRLTRCLLVSLACDVHVGTLPSCFLYLLSKYTRWGSKAEVA